MAEQMRDGLAEEVEARIDPEGYGWASGDAPSISEVIEAVMASDWLTAHVAAAVAERDAEIERLRAMLHDVERMDVQLRESRAEVERLRNRLAPHGGGHVDRVAELESALRGASSSVGAKGFDRG